MKCNRSIYNACLLVQESFKFNDFVFDGVDISGDVFIYRVRKKLSSKWLEFSTTISNNVVSIDEFNLEIGEYEHELLWVTSVDTDVVFQGVLKITDKANNCGCGKGNESIKVTTESTLVKVDLIIGRKGDKGNKGKSAYEIALQNGYVGSEQEWLNYLRFKYTDLTTEEIAELQQPLKEYIGEKNGEISQVITNAANATNSANQATANANNATEQANEATLLANQSAQNANNKAQLAEEATLLATEATEQANTATNNANNATNNAISATNEANQATANAINATNEANQATANANNAANFANAQRGWSPCFIFENDGATRVVKKLADWIGGTGAKPTDNVGQYVLDGGYTSDKSLATNFKGEQSDNLIAEYVHSGNKEVYITSIDYETYTFYAPNHGLSNSVNINSAVGFVFVNSDLEIQANVLPLPTTSVLYVVNSTTDTFQLSNSVGGAPLTLLNESALDVSKFRIELTSLPDISFTNTGLSKSIKISIEGKGVRDTNSQYLNARDRGVNILASSATANYQGAASRILPFRNSLFGYLDVDLINYSDFTVIKQKMKVVKSNGSSFSVESTERESISKPVMNLNNITFRSLPVANGAIIRLYK